jgi:DNA-binding response OmpR family regulator
MHMERATMPDMSEHILLIDDDLRLSAMVGDYLRSHGYQVSNAPTLMAGRELLARQACDALVLDLMLPDGDGLSLCKELRASPRTRALPLLMLSARGEPTDRIVGLEIGADDYLPKPFEPRELLARLRALLRRTGAQADGDDIWRFGRLEIDADDYLPKPFEPRELLARLRALLRRTGAQADGDDIWRFGRLEIDAGLRQVRLDNKPCELTSYQFDLLTVLAQHPGRVLSRDQIMDALKGHPLEAFDRSIDVHISRIRAAIEDDPKEPRRILTVRGVGYVFAKKQDADQEAP